MSGRPMLRVGGLTVAYDEIVAVRDVSFEVRPGEIAALLGANGAGKTSILRAISGIQPYAGDVVFEGVSLRGTPPERVVRSGVVHVPEGRGIFGNLTVMENLRLATWQREARGDNTLDVTRDWEFLFKMFPRLQERRGQRAETLSGGEQQMLAVGRALVSGGRLLLLDEPSMGLAPILVREIFRVLAEINRAGMTILLVEQNAHIALSVAHRAYVLETGRIVLSGTSAELADNPRVREAYLGG